MKSVVILLFLFFMISSVSAITIKEVFEINKLIVPNPNIEEVNGTTSYFYAGSKLIASKHSDNNIKYHHQDRLGSDINSRQLPFGQELVNSGNRFEFTGKELDDQSGLNYFGARYYDSNIGRFLGVDPVSGQPPYQYVANNPMNYIDPDGKRIRFYTDAEIDDSSHRQWIQFKFTEENRNMLKRMDDDFVKNHVNAPFGGIQMVELDENNYLKRTESFESFEGTPEQMALKEMLGKIIDSPEDWFVEFHSGGAAQTIQDGGGMLMIGVDKGGESPKILKPKNIGITLGSLYNEWVGSTMSWGPNGAETVMGTSAAMFYHEAAHLLGEGEGGAMKAGNWARAAMGLTLRKYYGELYDMDDGESYRYLYTGYQYDIADSLSSNNENLNFKEIILKNKMYDKLKRN